MSKKAREKPAEAGSASVSPYGSVLSYELVTSQPNRLINLIWPECRTWFIGPWKKMNGNLQNAGTPTTRRATSKFSIVQQNNISRMNAEMLKSI